MTETWQWCRAAGAKHVLIDSTEQIPADFDGCIGLPGTLEIVEDPQALLKKAASSIGSQGELAIAVSLTPIASVDSRRSFTPFSLAGLVAETFGIANMEIADDVLGLRAHLEPDAAVRQRLAHEALASVHAELDARFHASLRATQQIEALSAAVESLEAAVVTADEAHLATRKARNDAREKLKRAQAQRDAAKTGLQEARQRLQSIESSRWWRLGRTGSRTLRRFVQAPGRLLRRLGR